MFKIVAVVTMLAFFPFSIWSVITEPAILTFLEFQKLESSAKTRNVQKRAY